MKNTYYSTLKALISASPLAIVTLDLNKNIQVWNPAAEEIFGWKSNEVIGKNPGDFLSWDKEEFNDHVNRALKGETVTGIEAIRLAKDGRKKEVSISLAPLTDKNNEIIGAVKIIEDISEKKRIERENYDLSFKDSLTGLSNRFYFQKQLNSALIDAEHNNTKLAVLYIDLDRFKTINDSLGHDKGDLLLKVVASRLEEGTNENSIVSRFGGDEFAVLINNMADETFASLKSQEIIKILQAPIEVDNHNISISPSIGISVYPNDGSTAIALIRNADTAMYNAKEQGRNKFCFYEQEMHNKIINRLEVEGMIREGLRDDKFIVYFQPQVDCRTGKYSGFEALVRLQKNDEIISPAIFIDIAEESGLIDAIGEKVLRIACMKQNKIGMLSKSKIKMAVNISAKQFRKDIVETVKVILEETNCNPALLELELTEGAIMENPERSVEMLKELKSLGISIAIDDFGTGFSSLSTLKNFPIDKLKIDKAFINHITTNTSDLAIVKAIITMAKGLGIEVIAEGAESIEQVKTLQELGCFEIQGYYYSKPLPLEEFQNEIILNYAK